MQRRFNRRCPQRSSGFPRFRRCSAGFLPVAGAGAAARSGGRCRGAGRDGGGRGGQARVGFRGRIGVGAVVKTAVGAGGRAEPRVAITNRADGEARGRITGMCSKGSRRRLRAADRLSPSSRSPCPLCQRGAASSVARHLSSVWRCLSRRPLRVRRAWKAGLRSGVVARRLTVASTALQFLARQAACGCCQPRRVPGAVPSPRDHGPEGTSVSPRLRGLAAVRDVGVWRQPVARAVRRSSVPAPPIRPATAYSAAVWPGGCRGAVASSSQGSPCSSARAWARSQVGRSSAAIGRAMPKPCR